MKSLHSFLLATVFLTVLAGSAASGFAQGTFSKISLSGTIYTEDGLGNLTSQPLTKRLVMKLCDIVSDFNQYEVVAGVAAGLGDLKERYGIFVVNKGGTVHKGFVEYLTTDDADPTTGLELGGNPQGELIVPISSILESTAVTGILIGAEKHKPAPIQVAGSLSDGTHRFIMKAKVMRTGPFKPAVQ